MNPYNKILSLNSIIALQTISQAIQGSRVHSLFRSEAVYDLRQKTLALRLLFAFLLVQIVVLRIVRVLLVQNVLQSKGHLSFLLILILTLQKQLID